MNHQIDGQPIFEILVSELKKHILNKKKSLFCLSERFNYIKSILKIHILLDRLCRISEATTPCPIISQNWYDSHCDVVAPCSWYSKNSNLEAASNIVHEICNCIHFIAETTHPESSYDFCIISNLFDIASRVLQYYNNGILGGSERTIKELCKTMSLFDNILKRPQKNENISPKFSHHNDECVRFLWNNIHNLKLDTSDKVAYLTYVIKALLTDLQSEAFTRIIFAPEIEQQPDFLSSAFIPSSCTDIHGNTYNFNASYEFAHEVDLAKTIVISRPCEEKKIRDSVKAITQRGFVYQSNNHEMTYYADLDFAVVTNGYHSQCIGALKREGTVIAHTVFDTEKCYLNLAVLKHKQDNYTKYVWGNPNTNESYLLFNDYYEVPDVRIALLYEAGRLRWLAKNEQN